MEANSFETMQNIWKLNNIGKNITIIKSQWRKETQLPDTSQKVHLCPYVWKVRSQSSLNITKDTGGAEDCTVRVSRWCRVTGRSVNYRGKHSQHLLLAMNPLSSGFHEESFFHLWHLCFLNKLNLESHTHHERIIPAVYIHDILFSA